MCTSRVEQCRVRWRPSKQRIAREARDVRQTIRRSAAFGDVRDHAERFPQAAVIVLKVSVTVQWIFEESRCRCVMASLQGSSVLRSATRSFARCRRLHWCWSYRGKSALFAASAHACTSALRGRPPFLPFSRAAAAFATEVAEPMPRASSRIQAFVPKMPCKSHPHAAVELRCGSGEPRAASDRTIAADVAPQGAPRGLLHAHRYRDPHPDHDANCRVAPRGGRADARHRTARARGIHTMFAFNETL